jgi:hypothetical protein
MNESLIAQYEYFISQCTSLEALQAQENRLLRQYAEIPDELKNKISDKKVEILNVGDRKT